eukprot:6487888-Amphidinium_carterae.3
MHFLLSYLSLLLSVGQMQSATGDLHIPPCRSLNSGVAAVGVIVMTCTGCTPGLRLMSVPRYLCRARPNAWPSDVDSTWSSS